ncbi:MAG: hypothetical protein QW101_08295 [Ignisphaera sp.]
MCCNDIDYNQLALRTLLIIGKIGTITPEVATYAMYKACESMNITPTSTIAINIHRHIGNTLKMLEPYIKEVERIIGGDRTS